MLLRGVNGPDDMECLMVAGPALECCETVFAQI